MERAKWVDGRVTAGHQSAKAKHNLQIAEGTPEAREMGDMIVVALERNRSSCRRRSRSASSRRCSTATSRA